MDAAIEARLARREFNDALREARTACFEQGNDEPAEILAAAIAANKKLWSKVMEPLAKEAGTALVRKLLLKHPMMRDLEPFPERAANLFEDLGPRIKTEHGTKFWRLATIAEVRWHLSYREKRVNGSVARNEAEAKELDRIRDIIKAAEKGSGKNDSMSLFDALKEWDRKKRK